MSRAIVHQQLTADSLTNAVRDELFEILSLPSAEFEISFSVDNVSASLTPHFQLIIIAKKNDVEIKRWNYELGDLIIIERAVKAAGLFVIAYVRYQSDLYASLKLAREMVIGDDRSPFKPIDILD